MPIIAKFFGFVVAAAVIIAGITGYIALQKKGKSTTATPTAVQATQPQASAPAALPDSQPATKKSGDLTENRATGMILEYMKENPPFDKTIQATYVEQKGYYFTNFGVGFNSVLKNDSVRTLASFGLLTIEGEYAPNLNPPGLNDQNVTNKALFFDFTDKSLPFVKRNPIAVTGTIAFITVAVPVKIEITEIKQLAGLSNQADVKFTAIYEPNLFGGSLNPIKAAQNMICRTTFARDSSYGDWSLMGEQCGY